MSNNAPQFVHLLARQNGVSVAVATVEVVCPVLLASTDTAARLEVADRYREWERAVTGYSFDEWLVRTYPAKFKTANNVLNFYLNT